MAQVIRSPKTYDVMRRRFGRRRRHGGEDSDRRRHERRAARGRAGRSSRKRLQDVYVAVRSGASRNRVSAGGRRRISANFSRRTDRGTSRASRTLRRRDRIFIGFVRASSVGAPITGAASRCDFLRSISFVLRAMAWAPTGRSRTTISRRTTTKSKGTSAYSAQKRMCRARPTAFSCRRRSRVAPRLIVKKACDSSTLSASRRGWRF